VNITKKRLRIVLLILIGLSILYFLWMVRSSLYPFLIAFAIAYVLNPAVGVLTRRGTPRIPAILMVYAMLGSIVGIFAIFLVPILIRELSEFAATVPEFTRRMQILIEEIHIRYDSVVLPNVLRPIVDESIAKIQIGLQQFVRDIFDALLTLVTHTVGLLVVPILAFYILNEWEEIGQAIREFIPIAWRREFLLMLEEIDKVLSGVIRGQLTVGLFVMVLVSSGLHILGLDFAILIGIVAGLLDVVPYFGAVVGAVPAVALAALQSPGMVLKVILLFLVIHQLEGSILAPKILGDNVGMHPLTVVFALLVGGELFGFLGMLLAVPIAAILKVIAKHAISWMLEH
jgi:predicted PurR-regulated permease PerM